MATANTSGPLRPKEQQQRDDRLHCTLGASKPLVRGFESLSVTAWSARVARMSGVQPVRSSYASSSGICCRRMASRCVTFPERTASTSCALGLGPA
eukprot:2893812-Prymnesium_polylepis.2